MSGRAAGTPFDKYGVHCDKHVDVLTAVPAWRRHQYCLPCVPHGVTLNGWHFLVGFLNILRNISLGSLTSLLLHFPTGSPVHVMTSLIEHYGIAEIIPLLLFCKFGIDRELVGIIKEIKYVM